MCAVPPAGPVTAFLSLQPALRERRRQRGSEYASHAPAYQHCDHLTAGLAPADGFALRDLVLHGPSFGRLWDPAQLTRVVGGVDREDGTGIDLYGTVSPQLDVAVYVDGDRSRHADIDVLDQWLHTWLQPHLQARISALGPDVVRTAAAALYLVSGYSHERPAAATALYITAALATLEPDREIAETVVALGADWPAGPTSLHQTACRLHGRAPQPA